MKIDVILGQDNEKNNLKYKELYKDAFFIDYPEKGIHPKSQMTKIRELMEAPMLAHYTSAKFIVITHSTNILLTIMTMVANGEIDNKGVKIHNTDDNTESGVTKNGTYDNPEFKNGLDEIELKIHSDYLDAVEKRQRVRECKQR